MIHEPNTSVWPIGALVIHDSDAKKERMLMIVIGFASNGDYFTRYVDKSVCKRRYRNPLKYLHDPARFDIRTPND